MVDLVYCVTNLLFFIFHYYTIILISWSSLFFCLSFGNIYLSLGISLLLSFITVSELFYWNFLKFLYSINKLLLYCYFSLRSSIIFCLFSGDIYLSLGIYLSCSFAAVSALLCCVFFETLVILLAILLPIKSPVASAVFSIALFKAVLNSSVTDCLAWLRRFWIYLSLKFLLIFLPIFLAKDKNP